MGRLVLAIVLLSASLVAQGQTLTVLAAASLRESFTELARSFERTHPGVHVRLTFAGSQQLAASILLDAPADVFASADELQMRRLVAAGKASSVGVLCSNRLVIAVSGGVHGHIFRIQDLGLPGVRLVVAKAAVPAGAYADRVLNKLPTPEARAIRHNIRSRETDVRTVLARVALGEADAGIVYATDVAAKPGGVRSIRIPEELQAPVAYVIGRVKRTRQGRLADAFIALTLGKAGLNVLERHGFLPPPTPMGGWHARK